MCCQMKSYIRPSGRSFTGGLGSDGRCVEVETVVFLSRSRAIKGKTQLLLNNVFFFHLDFAFFVVGFFLFSIKGSLL